eukprot:TRINITY_DN4654_c0_g1_i1.p1 TRINITY_DN4654_c0_g1~~TRINITY_DN4654_c0_g1_i1.p1  ORF type:complete len:369 (+),score=82.71 TRINITY_DN4654_c0_g1_i1:1037-2143(+)
MLWLITEFLPGGSLQSFYRKNKLSFPFKLRVLLDVATGMNILHSLEIIYRDLKAENIMMCATNIDIGSPVVKLTDFGTSRKFASKVQKSYTKGVGTPIYMAPEIIRCEPYDHKVDVFSFGVLCWELMAQCEPYKEFDSPWSVTEFVRQGSRLPLPSGTPIEYERMVSDCWAPMPTSRPGFDSIVAFLREYFSRATAATRKMGKLAPAAVTPLTSQLSLNAGCHGSLEDIEAAPDAVVYMLAVEAHQKVLKQLEFHVEAALSSSPPSLSDVRNRIAMDDQCTLGKWLHAEAYSQKVLGKKKHRSLLAEHHSFHACAGAVLDLAMKDPRKALAELSNPSSDIISSSRQVLTTLLELHEKEKRLVRKTSSR